MQAYTKDDNQHDLRGIRHVLQGLIASYAIGWAILIVNVGNVPLLNGVVWELGALVCFVFTIILAVKLTVNTLVWWSAVVLTVVALRSFAYGSEGIFNPLGVWLLVLTGVSVTGLAVITVNALTGRLEEMTK